MKILKVELFPSIYQRLEITKDISIGRDTENQIVLKDMSISGQHAIIGREGEKIWIEDLGSTNGTFVNDSIIHKKYLEDRDVITIGYCKMILSSEEDCTLNFDLQQVTAASIKDKDDFLITLPSQNEAMAKLLVLLQERFTALGIPTFGKAIAFGLENAHIHGNEKDEKKQLRCRYQKTATYVKITISDQGRGFNYEPCLKNILTQGQESIRGIGFLVQESDAIEFNQAGNQIILVKNLVTTPNTSTATIHTKDPSPQAPSERTTLMNKRKLAGTVRHAALKYCRIAIARQPFPVRIVVSSQPLRIFPEHLDIKPAASSSTTSFILQVRPVFPGCLVSPALQDVDILQTPAKIEFWVTPMSTVSHYHHAAIHWVQDGKVIQVTKTPIDTLHTTIAQRLLWAALWLPLLAIILDIPSYPVNRELSALVQYLLYIINIYGGLSLFGLVVGFACLSIGLFLHWRARPVSSEIIHSEITIS